MYLKHIPDLNEEEKEQKGTSIAMTLVKVLFWGAFAMGGLKVAGLF
jgi:hypothetical protein